jgi:hypothetical protein
VVNGGHVPQRGRPRRRADDIHIEAQSCAEARPIAAALAVATSPNGCRRNVDSNLAGPQV